MLSGMTPDLVLMGSHCVRDKILTLLFSARRKRGIEGFPKQCLERVWVSPSWNLPALLCVPEDSVLGTH